MEHVHVHVCIRYTSTGFHRQLTDAASGIILKLILSHHDSTDLASKYVFLIGKYLELVEEGFCL